MPDEPLFNLGNVLSSVETSLQGNDHCQLVTHLRRVLGERQLYRRLLCSKGSDAQLLLNSFQLLLDTSDLEAHFRHSLIVATQRLSKTSGLYPACYELKGVKQIGNDPVTAGGFADVYKGEFEGQVVCLKVFRLYQDSQIDHLLKQFSKEVILWGQLSHVNVLPMYGIYRFNAKLCLVAPWMENGDLRAYLKNHPKADRPSLTADVAQGLSYLHRNNIVHGDLKGPNVLIDAAGRARVSDFGLSCISDPDIIAWTSVSSASSKGGSLRWQAPELFDVKNDEAVKNSTFSDIYALGCIFYEVYTGNIPFHHISRDATVIAQKTQLGCRPMRPTEESPAWEEWGLTEDVWALMEDCWENDPVKRPTTDQVIQRLDCRLQRYDQECLQPALSPLCFREKMNKSLDKTSRLTLDSLLSQITDMESATESMLSLSNSPWPFHEQIRNTHANEFNILEHDERTAKESTEYNDKISPAVNGKDPTEARTNYNKENSSSTYNSSTSRSRDSRSVAGATMGSPANWVNTTVNEWPGWSVDTSKETSTSTFSRGSQNLEVYSASDMKHSSSRKRSYDFFGNDIYLRTKNSTKASFFPVCDVPLPSKPTTKDNHTTSSTFQIIPNPRPEFWHNPYFSGNLLRLDDSILQGYDGPRTNSKRRRTSTDFSHS